MSSSKAALHRKRRSLPSNAFATTHNPNRTGLARSSSSRSVPPSNMGGGKEDISTSASPEALAEELKRNGLGKESRRQRTMRLLKKLWTKMTREIACDTGDSGVSALRDVELDQIVSFLLVPFPLERVSKMLLLLLERLI